MAHLPLGMRTVNMFSITNLERVEEGVTDGTGMGFAASFWGPAPGKVQDPRVGTEGAGQAVLRVGGGHSLGDGSALVICVLRASVSLSVFELLVQLCAHLLGLVTRAWLEPRGLSWPRCLSTALSWYLPPSRNFCVPDCLWREDGESC